MMERLFGRLNLWLVVGVFSLCSLLSLGLQRLAPLLQMELASAEVLEVIPGSRNQAQRVIVRFQTGTGQTVRARVDGSPFQRYEPGERIDLYYLPSSPEQITLPERSWWVALVLVVTVLVFVVLPLGIGIRKMRASRPTVAQAH